MALVIGADALDARARRLWRLAADWLAQSAREPEFSVWRALLPDTRQDNPYDPPQVLTRLLAMLLAEVPCQGAWLGILRGDRLTVEAQVNCVACSDAPLDLGENELLRRLVREGATQSFVRGQPEWDLLPRAGLRDSDRAWAFVPLAIGRRLIGALCLAAAEPFEAQSLTRLTRMAGQAASLVELLMTFSETTAHLGRLALLNDFVLTVSSAQNLDQIVRRVFALLTRAFRTELVALYLIGMDGQSMREYRLAAGRPVHQVLPLDRSPRARLVREGRLVRQSPLRAEYPTVHEQARAALLVPLRQRGQVIGAISLESERPDAFDEHDEHLLVVIASHLAGLVEYSRLREEAEGRARNLGLIHEVVQQVVGLTDRAGVAQITADLLAQYFAYDLAVVAFVDAERRADHRGVGGARPALVQLARETFPDPAQGQGIAGQVFVSGRSLLVNDVLQSPHYRPLPGWDPGSELCVPLRAGEQVIGVIDVQSARRDAFNRNDLLALESLAGILAGVATSGDQYRRLQATVHQLRNTQEELQARIEAQRLAESRLVQAAKLAAVGEMAAGIAHELNNPLTTVSGFTELVLSELPDDAPQRVDLGLVLREANRARDVVRRLLDFARQSESTRARADLNEIVSDVVTLVRHLAHTGGVRLQVELADDLHWVSVDSNQIKQVLLNLIHNALQAMPEGGVLTVSTRARQRDGRNWVAVAIADTGVGMTEEVRTRIFEPFFTTRGDLGGTGLGLAVSYGIISDHGGFIDVQSEPGRGSTFTVWLPV